MGTRPTQIVAVRNRGAAVLLVSEDLDELFELADRIVVMCNGRIVYTTAVQTADLATVGYYMVTHRGEAHADDRRRTLSL
jgi:simple sugar transport system ATP-binding protein